uniref:Uncharacterized protein n=1 Tax=Aegilops tauschii subsp. strangulata TaxID=200361 RepID=A0A453ECW3_AEGTS
TACSTKNSHFFLLRPKPNTEATKPEIQHLNRGDLSCYILLSSPVLT